MEKWYLPITILPGIGLLIISTSNLAVSLNKEMEILLDEASTFEQLLHKKLKQLRLLTLSQSGFYISTALMVLSGLVSVMVDFEAEKSESWGFIILLLGVMLLFISLVMLIIYSVRAVNIRQEHFKQCLIEDQEN